MNDYTILSGRLKREILNFSEKICAGQARPRMKLTANVLFGMAESKSCLLSEIGRALKEEISLKKTIERLSNGLESLGESAEMQKTFAEMIRGRIDENTIFIGDGGDMTKRYGKAFECLETVRDGSTGEYLPGYWTLEFAALTHGHKTPLPVYDRVYSTIEAGHKSQTNELFKALQFLRETFGSKGIRTLDRGYDSNEIYKEFFLHSELFIIRADKKRNVVWKGKTLNILQAANRLKGKYALPFTTKSGEVKHCKVSVQTVSLPALPGKQFRLVCLYGLGEEPLMLLTNLEEKDPRLNAAVVKVYLMRWRIEEHFRFKKQAYGLENFRVRSLNSIRAMYRLANLLTGFIALIADEREESVLYAKIFNISQRVFEPKAHKRNGYFAHYAIADGIAAIFRKTLVGIRNLLASQPRLSQLRFKGFA
jgi:hypothetical protein